MELGHGNFSSLHSLSDSGRLETLEVLAESARATGSRVSKLSNRLDAGQRHSGSDRSSPAGCWIVDTLIHSAGVISRGRVETAPTGFFGR